MALAVATVLYNIYAYLSLDDQTLGIWYTMFLPSISLILQTASAHISLNSTFPCVLYDVATYERPKKVGVVIWILTILSIAVGLLVFLLSMAFIMQRDDGMMVVIYQTISFCIIFMVTASFFADSLRYCSGWSYCDYLKQQSHQQVNYSVLPFTLPEKEMEIYLGERYIARRAHVV